MGGRGGSWVPESPQPNTQEAVKLTEFHRIVPSWASEAGPLYSSMVQALEVVCPQEGDMDFPGGPVVKNPPANAGDTGSIPAPGRSHMP